MKTTEHHFNGALEVTSLDVAGKVKVLGEPFGGVGDGTSFKKRKEERNLAKSKGGKIHGRRT